MGMIMGGDETATNAASETVNEMAKINSRVSLNSTMVCSNENEVDIQAGCKIIDSKIKQGGICTMNNKSAQNTTIKDSITQTSKQSIAQLAKAEGQNFSLNSGNVNASNIASESVSTNAAISERIQSSCVSDALNKNLVNCSGGDLVHSQIDQETASNINQECIQNTNLTNTLSQTVEQVITQKAVAVKKDAITAILMAIAVLIVSIGISTKLGAGKLIKYILMFFCAFTIIIIMAIFAWNMISSKDFNPPHGIQKSNTKGDYCPDTSLYMHNTPKYHDNAPTGLVDYYKSAIGCIGVGGDFYDKNGNQTVGYSTTKWPGPGPAPDQGDLNWHPPLDVIGTDKIENYMPECSVNSESTETRRENQCWAINSAIDIDSGTNNIDTQRDDTLMLPILSSDTDTWKFLPQRYNDHNILFPSFTGPRGYSYYRDKCLKNKCMWTPHTLSIENPNHTGLNTEILVRSPTGEVHMSLDKILDSGLLAYSYPMSTSNDVDDANYNFKTAHHLEYAGDDPWSATTYSSWRVNLNEDTVVQKLKPYAKRYAPHVTDYDLKHLHENDVLIPMFDIYQSPDGLKGARPYTIFPFCTGGRSIFKDQDHTHGSSHRGVSCSKKEVDSIPR